MANKYKLTQKELRSFLFYDECTGIFTWKISPRFNVLIGSVAGTVTAQGYIHIRLLNNIYKAHRLAWLYVYGVFPEYGIDHKDRNPAHNWISNLREATQQCNRRNIGNIKTNTSGVKGVYLNKKLSKWYAQIKVDYATFSLGQYSDFDDAVCARLAAEQCLGWSGCELTSPAHIYVNNLIGDCCE